METASGRLESPINDLLKGNPALSRVFESFGIDYCCGGARTLGQVCLEKGLDPAAVIASLAELDRQAPDGDGVSGLDLAELADHVEAVHHAYLRREIPRLLALTAKVARVHGGSDPRLLKMREEFASLAEELAMHLEKEERVLFPAIRQLQRDGRLGDFHCGSLSGPIAVMASDHEDASASLERIRDLTDGFEPPDWACNSYQAMLDGLRDFHADMAEHVRKEESLLFPRALEQERKA